MFKVLLVITFSILLFVDLSADVGKVTIVKGEASLNRDIQILKVHNNMGLLKQDIVETQEGRLQMLFEDKTVISLGKESRLLIKDYLYEEETGEARASFRIEKGFVQTISGAIGKISTELFTMQTATTTITSHGTIWSIKVNEDSEKYRVIEGKISLAFNDGLERVIEISAGETMTLQRGSENRIQSFQKNRVKSVKQKAINKYTNKIGKYAGLLNEDIDINEGKPVNDDGSISNNGYENDPSNSSNDNRNDNVINQ